MAPITSVASFLNNNKLRIVSTAALTIGVALVAIGVLALLGVGGVGSIAAIAMIGGGGAIALLGLILMVKSFICTNKRLAQWVGKINRNRDGNSASGSGDGSRPSGVPIPDPTKPPPGADTSTATGKRLVINKSGKEPKVNTGPTLGELHQQELQAAIAKRNAKQGDELL